MLLPKLIVILGPTATGKTKLAAKLARAFNGEIVSADSRQVYVGMDIGTGKDLKEYGRVPYHLIDVVNPKKRFTLSDYQKLAYRAIDDIIKRGKIPFLVGGTGLYISAIVDGYQLDDVKPDSALRKKLNQKSLAQLQALVKKYGLILNQSDLNNKRRLIRKIEIVKNLKNQNLSRAQSRDPKYTCMMLGLTLPKAELDQKIDQRLKERLAKEGLINEVKKLKKQGLSWKKLEEFGLEYRFIAQYLQGKLTYEQMTAKLATTIHQFAKRQMTWFKRDKRIIWLENVDEAKKIIKGNLNLVPVA
ncbi:MAG: tRNA (adenosine(37)-N6)-dimethylallyltransferase MiaA [Candidatus Komeilibacteria bacterium]|nr:tRNA (adenosine(37)-N6)-dimethylallyltransferase MiaA [Candidatus Komeilibacteria bacterium]